MACHRLPVSAPRVHSPRFRARTVARCWGRTSRLASCCGCRTCCGCTTCCRSRQTRSPTSTGPRCGHGCRTTGRRTHRHRGRPVSSYAGGRALGSRKHQEGTWAEQGAPSSLYIVHWPFHVWGLRPAQGGGKALMLASAPLSQMRMQQQCGYRGNLVGWWCVPVRVGGGWGGLTAFRMLLLYLTIIAAAE